MFEAFMPQAQDPNVAGPSLEELRKRKLMAELLQGRRGPPNISHPLQGVAHILDSALTGYREGQENKRQRAQDADAASIRNDMARALMGGSSPAPASAPTSVPALAPAPAPATGAAATQASGVSPASLIQSESGGDWGARNSVPRRDGTVGHFGRLQFSQPRIAEAAAAGAIPQGTTPQAFMASPELQQAAERWHFADIDRNIRERGLDRYVGQNINGVPVTLEGMRAVAHLGGNQGLARFLESGGRYNPADANGTSLLNYLGQHRPQQRAEGPADTLTGSDGMDEAPLVDGRNLPPDTQAPALGRPGMSFDEAMPPPDAPPPAPIAAGPDPQALAQALMSAPVPEPRPPMPAPSVDNMMAGDQVVPQGAPAQAPMPQPRPNLEPPPQAIPAGPAPQAPQPQALAQALSPQMNERDRLMLLRDEQSLAPGEADRLRQGLPNPQALAAVLQGRPVPQATPAPAPAQMPAQRPPLPQGMPQQMQAPQGAPQPGAPMAQQAPGQPDRALLARMMQNPQTRPFATQIIQQQMAQNTPQSQAALRQAQAQADIAERNARAPQNQIMTAPDGSIISVDPRTNQATTVREAARPPMTVPSGASVINPQTGQVIHTAPKEMSPTDKKAIMEAEDQIPVLSNTVEALRRARELNAQAYSGITAGALTTIGTSGIPGAGMIADPERAKASREFNQIMSGQAIESMSNTLKGATTDREMTQFKEILGNPSTPPDIRARTIDRMVQLAERQMALQQDRIRQLRGGDYFRPGQTPGQGAPQPSPQASPQPSPAAPSAVPQVGEVRRGYRYKGGDPSQQSSWERAQ